MLAHQYVQRRRIKLEPPPLERGRRAHATLSFQERSGRGLRTWCCLAAQPPSFRAWPNLLAPVPLKMSAWGSGGRRELSLYHLWPKETLLPTISKEASFLAPCSAKILAGPRPGFPAQHLDKGLIRGDLGKGQKGRGRQELPTCTTETARSGSA